MSVAELLKTFPGPLQYAVRCAWGWLPAPLRLGSSYREAQRLIALTEGWSEQQIRDWQLARLRRLVRHAAARVPYYRELYRSCGVNGEEIRTWSDWKRLPTVTKTEVRDNLEAFVAEGMSKSRLQYLTTGGSTAMPVGFYLDRESDGIEWAFMYSQWTRVGFRPGAACVVFRGGFVGSEGRYWKYDPLRNELHFSSYHLTDEHMARYLKRASRFGCEFIQAYPSAITLVASYLRRRGEAARAYFPALRAILCGSENLYPPQRRLLEEVFGVRVYSWYGHAERLILAGECEHSGEYHVFPQYGLAEVLREDGGEAGEGEVGELVGTSLHNFACPLVRYRTQDLAAASSRTGCPCGRPYRRLPRVEGRLQELVVTGTGRLISMTAVNMHSDVFDGVQQFQFVQHRPGEVDLNLLTRGELDPSRLAYIRREVEHKLGPDMRLHIRTVEEIHRSSAGKHRFLLQKLPVETYSWDDVWTGCETAQ